MGIAATVGLGLALVLLALSFWVRRRRIRRAPPATPARQSASRPSEALVWIDEDGGARELTESEKTYVDTTFSPFDGARPYVKSRYDERNGWGTLSGYLLRQQLPIDIQPSAAPVDGPVVGRTPQAVAASLRELIEKHESNDR